MNRQSLTWLFLGVFSACGGELIPNEGGFIEQQREVTYREGPTFDEGEEMGENTPVSPPEENAVGVIPSTGIGGLTPHVPSPPFCTPFNQPRTHEKMKVASGVVRVHFPEYCLDGEFHCQSFNIVTEAAHAGTRFAQKAQVTCFISPLKRMESVVEFDVFGRPTHGSLKFTDSEVGLLLETNVLQFGSGRAPLACDEGVTAAFSAFGNPGEDGADIGLMLRYTE